MKTATQEMMKNAQRRAMDAMDAAQAVLQRTDRFNTWAEEKQATEDWAEALAEANAWGAYRAELKKTQEESPND